ncbi:MAG: polysaccharide biosynthesis protein [Janthinobacterium lividum]
MLSTFNTYFNQKLGNFYKILFASILSIAVFIPLSLPILTHFIALIFLLEIIIVKSKIKQIFTENIKTFYLINIFSCVCLLSNLTSISPRLSLKSTFALTYYINLGFLMYCGVQITLYKKQIAQGLAIGFILGLLFGFIEAHFQGLIIKFLYDPLVPIHKYNKFTSVLMLLLPFIILISFKRFKTILNILKSFSQKSFFLKNHIQIILCILSIYIIFRFNSDASKLALIIDIFLICFFLCYFMSNKFKKIFIKILICFYFLAPSLTIYTYNIPKVQKVVLQTIKKGSVYDRLSIWQYVQNLSLNKGPVTRTFLQKIFGYGLNTSKSATIFSQDRTWISPAKVLNNYIFMPFTSQAIPLHPHNFVLQIWLELGYLGILVTFLFLNTFVNYIFRKKSDYLYIVASTLSLFNFMTVASIGYGIWQSWWLCTIILSIIVSKLFRDRQEITNNIALENSSFNYNNLKVLLQNKRILIANCGGWIGYKLYRQIILLQPSHLSLLDNSKNYLHQCFCEMTKQQITFSWQTLLCNISNLSRIKQIFIQERPDVVFHILNFKIISLTKDYLSEIDSLDAMGDKNIIESTQQQHIKLIVFILDDETLDSDNFVQITKKFTQKYQQYFNSNDTLEQRFMIIQSDDLFNLERSNNSLLKN